MSEHVLRRSQWVPRPVEEVFPFFERPENLERLTPGDLGFEILTPKPIAMRAGALIDYEVRPFGVRRRWRTRIESYEPPRRFTDVQVRGPYARWHHTHLFEAERGGTRLTDIVRYRLPFAPLGDLALPLVRRELDRIFDFRERAVAALFAPKGRKTMDIVLAGGSGFIGRHLTRLLLERGHRVSVLTRRTGSAPAGARELVWDGRSGGDWEKALDGCDAVVNLAGAGVADRPWTAAYRRKLVSSRLEPTRALVAAMARAAGKPRAFVSASAVGFYGDRGEQALDEDAARGEGFLAGLCADWEKEARRAEGLGVRTILLRLGVVLGRDGGALPKMLLPFKLALGGRLGSGKQWMPWIHVDDVVGLIAAALVDGAYRGVVNAVAPEAVTNAVYTRVLGRALRRPTPVPVPAFGLRLALGEMSGILLASQKVRPAAARRAGYGFRHPEIDAAMAELTSSPGLDPRAGEFPRISP
ncbi:MAG: TIGR01777 family oxidoreductase [Elusimicrobia bacterium]|nr:TIGR01777 family oxidoreductase [Elusimicrobiota bacterium]